MILAVCGLWFWHLHNCGWHVFSQTDTKMQTVLKLTSFDFVLNGQGNQKQNSDFTQVQILVSVSHSSFPECVRTQFLPAFTTFLHVTWKSGPLDVYCSLNKPKFLSDLTYTPFVRSLRAGSSLLWTQALRPYSGPVRLPRERKGNGRCVRCVC